MAVFCKYLTRSTNDGRTQPPTVVCRMGTQSEYATHCTHLFARLAPICMLGRCLVRKFLHRSSVGSLLRVPCWLGTNCDWLRWYLNGQGEQRDECEEGSEGMKCSRRTSCHVWPFNPQKNEAWVVVAVMRNFFFRRRNLGGGDQIFSLSTFSNLWQIFDRGQTGHDCFPLLTPKKSLLSDSFFRGKKVVLARGKYLEPFFCYWLSF